MNTQLKKPTFDPARRPKLPRAIAQKFPKQLPPRILLMRARRTLGVSRQSLATEMGVPNSLLRKYESGDLRIPNSVLLKIFMFGLDFWTDGISCMIKAEDSEQ